MNFFEAEKEQKYSAPKATIINVESNSTILVGSTEDPEDEPLD